MKTLVLYYSRGGTTARAAKTLQQMTDADLVEITGEKNYGSYFHALGVARKEFKSGELPEASAEISDFASYDRVLVGFPIWYSKCPQLVASCLKTLDFSGKDVFVFVTSGMSGPDGAMNQVREACAGGNVHGGLRVNQIKEDAIKTWLNG